MSALADPWPQEYRSTRPPLFEFEASGASFEIEQDPEDRLRLTPGLRKALDPLAAEDHPLGPAQIRHRPRPMLSQIWSP